MIHNKRGIVLKFLLTILLTIIIFAPTCTVLSKVFRLSDQGVSSFTDFAKTLQDFAAGTEKEHITLLILDEDTFVAKFTKNKAITTSAVRGGNSYETTIPYPSPCQGNDCVCLCRKIPEEMLIQDSVKEQRICRGEEYCVTLPEGGKLTDEQNTFLDKGTGQTTIIEHATYQQELLCESYYCAPLETENVADFFVLRHSEETRGGTILKASPRRTTLLFSRNDDQITVRPQGQQCTSKKDCDGTPCVRGVCS